MSIPPPSPLSYEGSVAVPFIVVPGMAPGTNPNFDVPTVWIDPTNSNAYMIVNKALGIGTWLNLGNPGPSGPVTQISGNTGTPIVPDTNGNVNIVGDGVTVTFSGDGLQTLTGSVIGGAGITTINGDSGSITGSTVTISANLGAVYPDLDCGASVQFINSGTVSNLQVTDAIQNTFIGNDSGVVGNDGGGNTALGDSALGSLGSVGGGGGNCAVGSAALSRVSTGSGNCALGSFALGALSTTDNNVVIGNLSAGQLLTGHDNIAVGSLAGFSWTAAESSNLCIGNSGTVGDSNTIRIGTQGSGSGQQNTCYVAGITGTTTANSNFVTIDTITGQLGATATAPSGFTSVVRQMFIYTGSPQTYTPTSGMQYCDVELWGGGGGGASCASQNFYGYGAASGGGGGGYGRTLFTAADIGVSQTVTIGAAGVAGTHGGNNPGGTGGTSSFGAFIISSGGVGGTTTNPAGSIRYVHGGAGGSVAGSKVDLAVPGGIGGFACATGVANNYNTAFSYGGGASFGCPAPSGSAYSDSSIINGASPTGYGGGGAGCCGPFYNPPFTEFADGAAGAPGYCFITEYCA